MLLQEQRQQKSVKGKQTEKPISDILNRLGFRFRCSSEARKLVISYSSTSFNLFFFGNALH